MAILQTGEHPLWFLLTDNGPVHIESIEDAVFNSALTPWPHALHIRFMQKRQDELVLAVNRDGFLLAAPGSNQISGIELYRFSEGIFWRQYTLGGLIIFNDNPAALLYLDSRFMNQSIDPPGIRTWTFNMESNNVFPVKIPVLEQFREADGWEADALRHGNDGLIYLRAINRTMEYPAALMFRTSDISDTGEEISAEVFYNSIIQRVDFSHYSLPALPDGFFYTGIEQVGDSLFASWEEQEDFSIGAAGFMVIKSKE